MRNRKPTAVFASIALAASLALGACSPADDDDNDGTLDNGATTTTIADVSTTLPGTTTTP